MRSAVKSRNSLCLMIVSPPQGQQRAFLIHSVVPQTQVEGSAGGLQPYHKQRASRNAPLWRWNPCFLIGTAVNQAEVPLSLAISNNLCGETL